MSGGMRPGPDIFGSLLHGVQKVAWELWGEQRGMFSQEFVQIYLTVSPFFLVRSMIGVEMRSGARSEGDGWGLNLAGGWLSLCRGKRPLRAVFSVIISLLG